MHQSIIEHKANMYYLEFREDFLAICLASTFKKILKDPIQKAKSSPYCKALILAVMESWTNHKRGKGEGLYIYMSYAQWINALYGMFGRTVILDSLDELVGDGLLKRASHKMYGKDSYKYLLNSHEVNRRIRELPARDPDEIQPETIPAVPTRPQIDASTSKLVPSKSKRVTRPQVNDTRPLVDEHPSTSKHNIESNKEPTKKPNIKTREKEEVPAPVQPAAPSVAPNISSLSLSPDTSSQEDVDLRRKHPHVPLHLMRKVV